MQQKYGLEFVNKTADKHLKSEGDAREARYQFLRQILASHMAKAIITAHHRDDYEETIVFNALRGTNIRGLVPFRADQQIIRPLVGSTKQELTTYARHNKLIWHEDNSNTLHKYMRNVLRSGLLPFIRNDHAMYESFQQYAKGLVALQLQTDGYLATWLLEHVIFSPNDASIDRTELAKVAFGVSQLLIYEVLRQLKPGELSQVVVREAARQARIARPATVIPLGNGLQLRVKTAIVIIMII